MLSRHSFPRRSVLLLLSGSILVFIIVLLALWLIDPSYTAIDEEDFEGVIFSDRRSSDLLGVMVTNDRNEDSYWTPPEKQILALEERLRIRVQEQLPLLAPWLNTYRRQYFGFVRDGKQLIMIVGFCKQSDKDWRRELITLPEADGCYFEAQFDVTNDVFLYVWQGSE